MADLSESQTQHLVDDIRALRTDLNTVWIMFCRVVERFTDDGEVTFTRDELYNSPEDIFHVERFESDNSPDERNVHTITFKIRRHDGDV